MFSVIQIDTRNKDPGDNCRCHVQLVGVRTPGLHQREDLGRAGQQFSGGGQLWTLQSDQLLTRKW